MIQNQRQLSFVRFIAVFTAIAMILGSINIPAGTVRAAETAGIALWEYQDKTSAPAELPADASTGSGTLNISGAAYTGFSSGSLCANGWHQDAFWCISQIDAQNYENLTFSAKMRSSNTGPKNFQLEYSVDNGESWQSVEGGAVEITSTSLSQTYDRLLLPAELSGTVFMLRVRAAGTTSLNGGTVASGGTSNINNIVIAGTQKSGSGNEGSTTEPEKPVVSIDTDVVLATAQWGGNANYEAAGAANEISGDLYQTNDMQDTAAQYCAVVNGKEVKPYTKGTSTGTGTTSYYMGGTGLGSGSDDYIQLALSSRGYGNMNLSFRLRSSNTGAGSYQLQYSADGKIFRNFTTGSYSYKYTQYGSDGSSKEVSKSGDITDGTARTSYAPANYINFAFDIPKDAENAEQMFFRLVPGTEQASGTGSPTSSGTLRMDSVVITGSPILSSEICGYVQADPQSGEAAVGNEITLTSRTEGAVIYYSINGGEYQAYDESEKPVLSALPQNVRAYAVKDGIQDSIKTIYQYTGGKVKTVKATPNGGAVLKKTEVTLSCDTEGAVIYYSEDNGETWTEYGGKLILSELPKTYQVKAVKDGYSDSSILTLHYTERTNEKYNLYFGQLHSHTNYSDGAGSCEEAYRHAANVSNLDFLAVTDHSNSFDNADSASILDGSVSSKWMEGHQLADQYTTDDFVAIYGYEMTWSNGLGHVNTFNTDGFQSRTQTAYTTYSTALQNYYAALKTAPDSITQFNHPGTTFGDFSDFSYYDKELDKLITTIEVGNGEGAVGSSGYFPSYEYYQRALDKGWHVAPTNNQDNHKGLWGDANTARSVVLADRLNRENIYDAMRNYRVYATEDNDLNIYYTLDGYEMGSILSDAQVGDTVHLKAELSDQTDPSIGKVQVITNGGLILDEKNVSANDETVEFDVRNDYSYYYLKVTEADGDIAVTAPVWVGEVEAAGINSLSTEEVLPVKGKPLKVDLSLYNNENTDMTINSIEFTVDGKSVHKAELEKAGLTSVAAMKTAEYSFDFTYDQVGSMELNVNVSATLNGVEKLYKSVLKMTYVTPEMVTNVIIDGTHYNDYVTGYYGGNVGNFMKIAGNKNIKVNVVTDEITPEMLEDCSLLLISAPAKKTGTGNAGNYIPSHFSDDFISMVKDYTDNGGTLIICGLADYQDSVSCQTAAEMNKLLSAIGATTSLNSDEAYDEVNNGGQPYRLYLKNYNKDSQYLAGAEEVQEYSAYSGCSVRLNEEAVAAGKAEALVTGYDTTYSIDCKDENGKSVPGTPAYIAKGTMTALAHEKLDSGADLFVSGTVFISDFEIKAEKDNNWDLPYLNRTIAENILEEVTVKLAVTPIQEVRKAEQGEVFAIEGYVTAGTDNEKNKFFDTIYVQDDTAGITVFPYSEKGLKIGTKVRITGYADAYQGDKELQVIKAEILPGETRCCEPEKMSAKDAMNYEKNGGKLVEVTGRVSNVLYDAEKTGVSQIWIDDGSGQTANIFIDGYIFSGTTGKNELASIIRKGAVISAAGLVYAHPEGESEEPVICLRVRNCDEITLKEDNYSVKVVNGTMTDGSTAGRFPYNTRLTVTADMPKPDQKFAGWKTDGKIISTEKQYTFFVGTDITVTAEYTDLGAEAPKVEAWAELQNVTAFLNDSSSKYDLRYLAQMSIPKGCHLVDAGLVWTNKAPAVTDEQLDLGNVNIVSGVKATHISKISTTGQFTVTIKGVPENINVPGKIFAVYTDAEGKSHTIYSDVKTGAAK